MFKKEKIKEYFITEEIVGIYNDRENKSITVEINIVNKSFKYYVETKREIVLTTDSLDEAIKRFNDVQ